MNAQCDTVALNTALLDVYRSTERCLLNFVVETTCCLILACVIRRMWIAVRQSQWVFYSLACIVFIYIHRIQYSDGNIYLLQCVGANAVLMAEKTIHFQRAIFLHVSLIVYHSSSASYHWYLQIGIIMLGWWMYYLFIFSHQNRRLIFKLLEMWIL